LMSGAKSNRGPAPLQLANACSQTRMEQKTTCLRLYYKNDKSNLD